MTELATGYISLVVETSKIPKQVGDAMKGVEGQADRAGQSMGNKLGSGISKTLKRTALGAGVAAGAAVGAGIAKGVGRLTGIENAEASLEGLGHSGIAVEGIMTNALDSVRGTAYGLDEAATIAASAVAAGVKPGRELERTLKLTGDAAAIAKTDLSEMGSIINKVATADMMQMDVANQLMDAGIPILQLVGKEMGVTAEEARKLASDGKVSFETFQNALESGLGGAALKLGETTSGAFRNMWAAAGRLGARLAGPFYDQAAGAFGGVTDVIDNLDRRAGPVMADLDAWLTGSLIPGLGDLGTQAREAWADLASSDLATTSITRLDGLFSRLLDSGVRLAPAVGDIVESLGRAGASIGISTWEMLLAVLESSAVILDATLVPALEFTADLMQDNQAAVTALVAAYMAFKTVPAIMERIAPAFTPIVSGATSARGSLSDFTGAVRDSYRWMGQANPQMGGFAKTTSILGANAGAAARGGLSALGRAGGSLLDVFGGPLGAAFTAVSVAAIAGVGAHQKQESAQRSLTDASSELAMAQSDMWAQIADSAGVADAVVDQIRAVRAEMDAAIAGEQRGFGATVAATFKGMAWSQWGDGLLDSDAFSQKEAANQVADNARLAKAALDDLKMSNDDVAAAISGSTGDWDAFALKLHATKDGGQEALAGLQPLRDEFVQMQEAQRLATPGALDLAAAVDVLADSAASGDDKLSALKRSLQALGLMETDAEASMFELAEAVDKVVESAAEGIDHAQGFGDALLGMNGKLDPTVKNAQALRNELGPLRDTIQAAALETGDATGAYAASADAVQALADKYGLTTEKIREFLGATPEQLNLLVSLDGADEARQKLVEVALQLDQIPDDEPKVVKTRVESDEAIAALEDLGLRVQKIDGQPGMVRITADGTVAVAAMNAIARQVVGLDASTATPKIDADATIFRLEDEAVRASLQHLDGTDVAPEIGAIIDNFINGRDVTLAELARIDASTAEPDIKAEISQAMDKARLVNDALDRAARDRTARITTEHYTVRMVDSAGVQVGQNYGRASGGRVPERASGGRLPLTGPGTDRTDGFLGVGSDGVPTAWVDKGEWVVKRESSQKYNGVLSAINRDDPSVRHLQGLRNGGMVSADEVLDFLHARTSDGQSRSLQGAPYLWAQVNWGDCSAAQAAAWNFATGLPPFATRFATGNQLEAVRALGGVPGPGGPDDLTTAWYNGGPGGGHTTGSVGGVHFEMGGGAGGMGKIGGAAASPFSGPWQHIYHLPLQDSFDWSDKAYSGRRGSGLTVGQYAADQFSGRSDFGARGGAGGSGRYGGSGQQRPATWSEIAGLAAADIVGGQVEDALGVFGIPNQLPPALQAWNMLNEPVGDGPTDWDLSVLAAEASKLDAEVKVREDLVARAASVIEQINTSPVGNALPAQMVAAQDQLDAEKRELERVRAAWEQARTRLDAGLLAREAELTEGEDDRSGGDALGLDKKRNAVLDKEEALRKARGALSDAESKTGEDRDERKITDARARLDKAERDLDVAKRTLDEAQAKFREDGGQLDEGGAPATTAQPYNPDLGAEQWTPIIDKVLREKGLPLEYRGAVIHRGNQESRGNPKAVNDWDANARAGFPTKGWMQARQDTFDAFADPGFGDIFGVEDSLRASLNYVMRDPKFRGRTVADVYRQAGGYFRGGEVELLPGMQPGVDNVPAWLTAGERVVRNGPSQRYAEEIDAMNAGNFTGGGDETHFHFQVLSMDEAERRRQMLERRRAVERIGPR